MMAVPCAIAPLYAVTLTKLCDAEPAYGGGGQAVRFGCLEVRRFRCGGVGEVAERCGYGERLVYGAARIVASSSRVHIGIGLLDPSSHAF